MMTRDATTDRATGPVPFRSARARTGWTLPGGARVAVWIVPNVEFFPLDMPIPGGTGGVPDVLSFATRDYGARVGFFRVLDALKEVGARGTAAVNASVVEAYPELVAAMQEETWDVMGHSWTNSRRLDGLAEGAERDEITLVTDTLTERSVPAPPRGGSAPDWPNDGRRWSGSSRTATSTWPTGSPTIVPISPVRVSSPCPTRWRSTTNLRSTSACSPPSSSPSSGSAPSTCCIARANRSLG